MHWTGLGRHLLIGGYVIALATAAGAQDGATPLHQAVRANDLQAVESLEIKSGADVKAASQYDVTPMHIAAMNGNAAMLRRLLSAGAGVDTATPLGGETALMTAARTGNVEAVTLLLARGANVNAKDTVRAQTALMWAVTENHPEVGVKLLVARGAGVRLAPYVCAARDQQLDHLGVVFSHGPHQRRLRAHRVLGVDVRAPRQQERDRLDVAGPRRRHQRRLAARHRGVHAGARASTAGAASPRCRSSRRCASA